ncbi:prolyl oligopeptidase family serine peptidase [Brevundimonas sp.]|uniref:prolyl oligopeptidase family serine peptidase n=1 Tax=Brevundimonas sp. TaxID=1871086 RepID=UPI001D89AE97|nr:prolyl oligopeptidase family serine peptidase [Brevundimonas sp.]MBA4000450.1 S9 family peptidase [Brevundimonas sp.]
MFHRLACRGPVLAALVLSLSATHSMAQTSEPAEAPTLTEQAAASDPWLWLEDIEGERAMAWVEARNEHSLGVLTGDPRYDALHSTALDLVQARDRIPFPAFRHSAGGQRTVDNFWQDASHVRGVWRRATLDSYRTDTPEWRTILDVDALASAENANWVWKGAECLAPDERLCLVSLSDGGKDAVVMREFDRETGQFIENGFDLPESKGAAGWVDENTLLVYRDFGDGTLTDSGYAMTVRRMTRGQSIDAAPEVFRGRPEDVLVAGYTLRDADGVVQAEMVDRAVTFFETESYFLTDAGAVRINLPARRSIQGLLDGQMIVTTDQDWTDGAGTAFEAGDLIAFDLEALKADPQGSVGDLILRPGERESVEDVTLTRNRLVVALFENVRGAAYAYHRAESGWVRERLNLPENASVSLSSASSEDDLLFVTVRGYLTPDTLWLADTASGALETVKSLPPKFDAEGMHVEQHQARSADGTMVPYFVVSRDGIATDGSNPTLLYGYGGFQVSLLPSYSATVGKLWLERGGVYVVANTRGGGEFGPGWHQAAQGVNRQRAHEDFQAVAEDLIARGVTSPRRLGVMGGSQGGLFMGALLTQRPDLINAAIIQVPLFDMLRFHTLLAGASWMGEYGNPDIAEQREWIAAYSPYQALSADADYPEVFIHTSTKDDRVHPGHARKAAAQLEALGHEVLFYENTDGGHAAGANLRETARRLALEYTYLTRRLMD